MNKIDRVFATLKETGETAFIPFITVGDPTLEITIEILKELERAGADIVELGIPYSDPLADGPVIQQASLRALKHNITIKDGIELAATARNAGVKMPFVLFSYFNPILQVGIEDCFKAMQENDISGIIIPDLPLEESNEVRDIANRYGVHLIPLVAPTSDQRINQIVEQASGFIYCVSSLGVTGVRSEFDERVEQFIRSVKQATTVPAAIGFGVSTVEHVKQFARYCDGVVVGSAIIRKVEEVGHLLLEETTRTEGLDAIYQFVKNLKSGTQS